MTKDDIETVRARHLRSDPTDFTPVYVCSHCWRRYAYRADAILCASQNEKVLANPGAIIRVSIGYGWYDGLEHWMLLNQGHEFHGKKTHDAYFIVTAVTHHDHRARYSIKTLGIKNGNKTGLCGWTSNSGHIPFEVIHDPDPRLLDEGKSFIGEVYDHLI